MKTGIRDWELKCFAFGIRNWALGTIQYRMSNVKAQMPNECPNPNV